MLKTRRIPAVSPATVALLTFFFFEPQALDYLQKYGDFGVWARAIDWGFEACALAVTIIAIIKLVKKRRESVLKPWILFFVSMAAIVCSTMVNSSLTSVVSIGARVMVYAGLAITLCYLWDKSPSATIDGILYLFLFLTVLNIASILATPYSATEHSDTGVLYLFGGKNAFFLAELPFILMLAVKDCHARTMTLTAPTASLFFAMVALYVRSISSVLCFLLMFVLFVMLWLRRYPSDAASLPAMLAVIAAVFLVIIVCAGGELFDDALRQIGRSSSFSGRDILWAQAFENIVANPVFGAGTSVAYLLRNGFTTPHPHCFYLQFLAQYGLVFMVPFLALILQGAKEAHRSRKSVATISCVICFGVLLFHNLFDVTSLKAFVLVLFFLNVSCNGTLASFTQKELSRPKRRLGFFKESPGRWQLRRLETLH